MLVDRLKFLALASSLSIVACSSSSADVDTDEGASTDNGGVCLDPGVDGTPDTALVKCEKVATDAAKLGEDFKIINDACNGYTTNFKSEASKRAATCVSELKLDKTGRGFAFDWMGFYQCGYKALTKTCVGEGMEGLCRSTLKTDAQRATWNYQSEITPQDECSTFLSGLNKAGREDVVACSTKYNLPIYSCVEGISLNADAKICSDPNARLPTGITRRTVGSNCEMIANPESKQVCLQFVKSMRANVALSFTTQLQQSMVDTDRNPAPNVVHNIGVRALRSTCGSNDVVAACKTLVDNYVRAGKSNAGGRITRECRTLFPGLLKEARDRVTAAVPDDGKIATAIVALPTPATAAELPETAE